MKIIFFGSKDCQNCKRWMKIFNSLKLPKIVPSHPETNLRFFYIDAFDDKFSDYCDKHAVDELPHTKIFDLNDKLIFNKIGFFSPVKLYNILYSSDEIRKKALTISERLRKSG